MYKANTKNLSEFYVAGISYKKADTQLRGQFSIHQEQYSRILEKADEAGFDELFILSTCNRTEIYGFAGEVNDLIHLLCSETAGDENTFKEIAYIKNGVDALQHFYEVAAGLDSQILGDYEIIGQIKMAVKFAKEKKSLGAFLERLVNSVLQSSKAIKNQTELSGGTVSVSFAAVQYILKNVKAVATKNIVMLGTGKMGKSACRNIVDYSGTKKITLINRTNEKAAILAGEMGLIHAPLQDLPFRLAEADIIIVATNDSQPTVLRSHLAGKSEKLIIDLTVPSNVESSVHSLQNITLVNVDELSKLKDETLAKREAEVPKAKAIIAEHMDEFIEWYEMRKHVPVLKAVKTKLKEIQNNPLFIPLYPHDTHIAVDEKIQRVINGMASKMKMHNQKGCHYLEAINEFIA